MQSRNVGLVLVVGLAACAAESTGNTMPTIEPLRITTAEDTPITVDALANVRSARDGVTVSSARTPQAGASVTYTSNSVMIAPPADFAGVMAVSYTVTDGTISLTGVINLTVTPVNDAPVAKPATLMVHRRTAIDLVATDVDSTKLTYEIVQQPSHGTLTGTPPMLEYTPAAGFLGGDTFVFRASDDAGASTQATVAITVVAGAAPVADARDFVALEDFATDILLSGSSQDGLPLTFQIVTQPAHGTLTGDPPNLRYLSAPDYHGEDQFTFTVNDGITTSDAARVRFTVLNANDAPVPQPKTITIDEDTATAITLVATDIDGDTLGYTIASQPLHGTLGGVLPNVTYTPTANFNGVDSFTFRATDFTANSLPATVTINITPVDDAPIAPSFTESFNEDTARAITLRGSDPDGTAVTMAIATQPVHGTLTGVPPAVLYVPAANFNGTDSFTYTASSGGTASAPGTVTLQIAAVDDAPTTQDLTVTTSEDQPVTFTLPGSDVDDNVIFEVITPPSDGTLTTGTGATRTYTPALNANGARSFTFRVSDVFRFKSATATVHIEIAAAQDSPIAIDHPVFTEAATPVTVDVLAEASDPDGDPISVTAVSAAAHGSFTRDGGELTYTPAAGFTGVEDLTYTISDDHGNTASAHVRIGVNELPPGLPDDSSLVLGSQIAASSLAPSLSNDGRFVAFSSPLALTADDTNNANDVYVLDRVTSDLERVSVASDGSQGNGVSLASHISGSGRYVVFHSTSSNLVTGDTNQTFDVFRHDRVTGETIRVSVSSAGAQGTGSSNNPEVSDDGNVVVFSSAAFDLVADDFNGASDVLVRNISAGTTTRVSLTDAGGDTDGTSNLASISGDGRVVAFTSNATNLVAGDSNGVADVFVRDLVAGTLQRVSVSSTGGQADSACQRPSLSRDGRFVSFLSDATTLVAGSSAVPRAYVRDRQAGTTTRNAITGATLAKLSGDGRYLAVSTTTDVTIFDRFAGTQISTFAGATFASLSDNGRYAVMITPGAQNRLQIVRNPR